MGRLKNLPQFTRSLPNMFNSQSKAVIMGLKTNSYNNYFLGFVVKQMSEVVMNHSFKGI